MAISLLVFFYSLFIEYLYMAFRGITVIYCKVYHVLMQLLAHR